MIEEANYVVGADPELMVANGEELISAIPLIPGTKEAPQKVESGAIQHDNVLAEFNVNPANHVADFIVNMETVLRQLAKVVYPSQLVVRGSADYPKQALASPETRIFGCDPDFDAYKLEVNKIPAGAAKKPFRSAGGHLHLGFKPETKEVLEDPYGKIAVIRMCDVFIGLPSIFLDPDETSAARRKLYGKAGAHRPKEYGVEYRTLGNWWVASPDYARLIYSLGHFAVEHAKAEKIDEVFKAVGGEKKVQSIINNSKIAEAREAFSKVAKFIPAELYRKVQELEGARFNIYQEWGL